MVVVCVVVFLWWCLCGGVCAVVFLWWCFCGGVCVVFLWWCFCGGIFVVGVFVVGVCVVVFVWWCLCGGVFVVVFLWWGCCCCCCCFLSGFAFYRATKNDAFLSINVDILLLWSGIAGQLLFTKSCCYFAVTLVVRSFAVIYKTLTRHFGLSGYPASSFCLGAGIARLELTTFSPLRACRTLKTVVKCKVFTWPIDPFVTSCVSDAQNCGKTQILELSERPFRHFVRVGRSTL